MEENGKKQKKLTAKRIISYILAAIVIVVVFLCCFGEKPEQFTEEEHIARITRKLNRKIKKKFSKAWFTFEYDSFEVYPLYDQDDKFEYFLVEFEPSSFIFIHPCDGYKYIYFLLGIKSMYLHSVGPIWEWSPYTFESIKESYSMDEYIWKTDENGEKIVYDKSPYAVAGVENEKMYYFGDACVPAVKRGDKFINLVSMTEVLYSADGSVSKSQPHICPDIHVCGGKYYL